ncbi:unnamed protein product [Agarophyton chilense]|eukprot:gb/GEZJ01004472.1/.p1 GENE.gb/GEZJ01004472.1/~~gb/GEZJ01004472.1/.p1  ORF type:complete len:366 (-),score=27.96 gb/GEZJ01004472.1/:843-1940(-)
MVRIFTTGALCQKHSFKLVIDMPGSPPEYCNFADAVVSTAPLRSSASRARALGKRSPDQQSYQQLPYHKSILLKTHHLVLHSHPKNPNPHHYSFVTSSAICFNIFPATTRHLQENDFIWHAVNAGSLSVPLHLQGLLNPVKTCPEATTFALIVPSRLGSFLRRVSLQDMQQAVINMLADAAQGESEQGVLDMKDALDPSIWNALTAVLRGQFEQTESTNRASFLLDNALIQVTDEDPWKVRATLGIFGPPTLPFLSGAVLESMNEDWMLYLRYLPDQHVAMFVLEQLILQGRQAQVWDRLRTVLSCASMERYYLSLLPMQLIEGEVIPRLLLDAACGHGPESIGSLPLYKHESKRVITRLNDGAP